ncbi:unnamed protein product [Ixodes hexagonus]
MVSKNSKSPAPTSNSGGKTSNGTRDSVVKKAVFITGCDTGFGHELAKRLDADGFQVLAGCLNPSSEGALMLRDFCSPSLRVVHLDVTKEDHIRRAAKTIAGELGTRALWAVVANAGMMSAGELEWGSSDSVRYLFEVNVFGVVNIVKMTLPFLRRAQGARVVIVASVAGRVTYPGLAYYCMSKHAVVSFADGLRREMRKWSIGVSTIEPVLYRTKMALPEQIQCSLDQAWQDSPESVRETYGKHYFEAFRSRCLEFLARRCRDELYEVVDNMVHAVSSRRPKRSYFCGGTGDRFRFSLLRWLSPTTVDRILCSINQSEIRRSVSDE